MPDWSFPDFDWNDGNVERLIERRGSSPDQNEEAVFNGAHARLARRGIYCAYGQDDSGRFLVLVVAMRGSTLGLSRRVIWTRKRGGSMNDIAHPREPGWRGR